MRIKVCVFIIGALLCVVPPAHATTTNTSTKCFHVGLRSNSRDITASTLPPSDTGFGWLRTEFSYGLRLQGKQYRSNGRWYFEPERFAIGGETVATSGGNPSGQALGSMTTFRLVSTDKVRRITDTKWSNTAMSQVSGAFPWTAPLTGSAAPSTGLYQLVVQSAVAAGGDGPSYRTTTATWSMPAYYRAPIGASSPSFPGLVSIRCSAVGWDRSNPLTRVHCGPSTGPQCTLVG